MKWIRDLCIRRRTAIMSVAIFIALSWVATGVYFHVVETGYIRKTAEKAKLESHLADLHFRQHLAPLRIIPNIMARMPAVTNALEARQNHTPGTRQDAVLARLLSIIKDSKVSDVILLDAHNRCIRVIGFDAAAKQYCTAGVRKALTLPPNPDQTYWYRSWFGRPALYHAAKIVVDGKVYGRLIGKVNIQDVFQAMADKNAFVSDPYGVVVLARTPSYLLHTLPDSTAYKLPLDMRKVRYGRTTFPPLAMRIVKHLPSGTLVQWHGRTVPSIMEFHKISQQGFSLYLSRDLENLPLYHQWRYAVFALLAGFGSLLIWQGFSWWEAFQCSRRRYQKLRRQNDQLKKHAYTDALTGATNRRYFYSYADKLRGQAIRHKRRFCIIYIDFDNFKQINDRYGHKGGDEALRQVSAHIRRQLRSGDQLSRLGGDEFAILMPGTGYADGLRVCKRICRHISRTPVRCGAEEIRVTLSLGLTVWDLKAQETICVCCNRADQALYAAKSAGRNQVRGLRPGGGLHLVA